MVCSNRSVLTLTDGHGITNFGGSAVHTEVVENVDTVEAVDVWNDGSMKIPEIGCNIMSGFDIVGDAGELCHG